MIDYDEVENGWIIFDAVNDIVANHIWKHELTARFITWLLNRIWVR